MRRIWVCAVVGLGLAGTLFAQVMVTGLPSRDGKPQNSQSYMSRAAMDGTFVADKVAPGEYTVIALLPGYVSGDDLVMSDMDGLKPDQQRALLAKNGTVVVHGAETATRDVVLTRGAAVSGRVLYSDGSPATQINILVEDAKAKSPESAAARDQITRGEAFRGMMPRQSSGTDDQWQFCISGLP